MAVHSLALACLPIWFFGACGLSRRFGVLWTARAALVTYAFAMMAMMNAVVIDGLVSPGLAGEIVHATGPAGQGWRVAFNHNSLIDQAFMRVFLVASSAAIVLWSASIMRSAALARGVGIYGVVTYGKFLPIEGRIQDQENATSVKADVVRPLEISDMDVRSHDFH